MKACEGHFTVVVANVDCAKEGRRTCFKVLAGGRSLVSCTKFAKEALGHGGVPANMEIRDAPERTQLNGHFAMSMEGDIEKDMDELLKSPHAQDDAGQKKRDDTKNAMTEARLTPPLRPNLLLRKGQCKPALLGLQDDRSAQGDCEQRGPSRAGELSQIDSEGPCIGQRQGRARVQPEAGGRRQLARPQMFPYHGRSGNALERMVRFRPMKVDHERNGHKLTEFRRDKKTGGHHRHGAHARCRRTGMCGVQVDVKWRALLNDDWETRDRIWAWWTCADKAEEALVRTEKEDTRR